MPDPSQSHDAAGPRIWICRHVETEKNLHDIHGSSSLARLTPTGVEQAKKLSAALQSGIDRPNAILSTSTPQAVATAHEIARLTGLPLEGVIGLSPVNLGVADGLSNEELLRHHPGSHDSLNRFRARVISAKDLELPGSESARHIAARLNDWWSDEGRTALPNRLIVGSNSTVLMLAHWLCGTPPTSDRYRCLRVPNGTMRSWVETEAGWRIDGIDFGITWPDREMRYVEVKGHGNVACTDHAASWAPSGTVMIVVPGYFGSSRHGPYGLYNRLARSWAEAGFRTVTVDPLGSGDSSDTVRTFESEVQSVVSVARELLGHYRRIVLVGHSLGTATVLAAREHLMEDTSEVLVWGLAPLVTFEDTRVSFFSERQLAELAEIGATTRHGLILMRSFIEEAERAWVDLRGGLDASWVGDADPYMTPEVIARLPQQNLFTVTQADHNFSVTGNVDQLCFETLGVLSQYGE